MKMAGPQEFAAFKEQNVIRSNPKSIARKVAAQEAKFDPSGRWYLMPDGFTRMMSNEGVGAWTEAVSVLNQQPSLSAFQWNDYLALAAEDHCNDTGGRGLTGHTGTDGSRPSQRANRYG